MSIRNLCSEEQFSCVTQPCSPGEAGKPSQRRWDRACAVASLAPVWPWHCGLTSSAPPCASGLDSAFQEKRALSPDRWFPHLKSGWRSITSLKWAGACPAMLQARLGPGHSCLNLGRPEVSASPLVVTAPVGRSGGVPTGFPEQTPGSWSPAVPVPAFCPAWPHQRCCNISCLSDAMREPDMNCAPHTRQGSLQQNTGS